jgi:hypothetical protein
MCCSGGLVRTGLSEERIAPIIRVKKNQRARNISSNSYLKHAGKECVALVRTDVSEERIAYIITVKIKYFFAAPLS